MNLTSVQQGRAVIAVLTTCILSSAVMLHNICIVHTMACFNFSCTLNSMKTNWLFFFFCARLIKLLEEIMGESENKVEFGGCYFALTD